MTQRGQSPLGHFLDTLGTVPFGSLYSFKQLITDGLHSAYGWMAILFFYVVQFNQLYIIMLAYRTHRLVYLFPQF